MRIGPIKSPTFPWIPFRRVSSRSDLFKYACSVKIAAENRRS